jgi:multiple sugar transport system permease protein
MGGRDQRMTAFFIAPAVVIVGLFMYYPMVATFIQSLYSSSFANPTPRFAGLALYEQVLTSPDFGLVVLNSCTWTLVVITLQNVIGFLTALLLNQRLPGEGLLRSLVLLPWILPGVVTAVLWRFLYDPQLGLINSVLVQLGLSYGGVAWLAQDSTAMAACILAATWKGFPFSTLIYLAALQTVDREQIEAAIVDGAGPVRRLIDIVLPALKGVVAINLIITTILTFNYFDLIWVLTRGGPRSATHIFPTKIYEVGFGEFQFGRAAVYGVFSILVLAVLLVLYFLARRPARMQEASA